MGTVMNGNVWSGACVNGKVVSGLAKNGGVFYRKPVSTYRRRIMVGDSLGGKDIYNDFPTGYYSTFPTGTNSFTTLVESNGAPLIYENVINSPQDIEVASDEMVSGYSPYHYVDGEETISEKMTIDDYDTFDVTNITDNSSYRHLFIEDENIRPLKVGDVITGNTKLYFTFPDDFRNELPNQWTPSIHDIVILNENSTENTRRMSISYTSSNNNDCMIRYWYKAYDGNSWGGNTNATIFDLAKKRNLSFILAGDMNQLESVGFVGTVSTINTTSPAYKYILVDTTTLGA